MKNSARLIIITALFVTCLLTANIIAVKIIKLGPVILPAAVFIFPFSYIFGDVLTEVYGYQIARRTIWIGFACNLVMVFFFWLGQVLPAAPFWTDQPAYQAILGYTPRLLAASFLAYLVGEFTNSVILAKMKVLTRGRWLWTRTIGSTIIGEGLDSVIFLTLAFAGTVTFSDTLIFWHWLTKVLIEVAATPLTYLVVNYLKRKESLDTFDAKTNFNPFRM